MEDSAKEEEWTGVWREVGEGGERERWEKMKEMQVWKKLRKEETRSVGVEGEGKKAEMEGGNYETRVICKGVDVEGERREVQKLKKNEKIGGGETWGGE